jgi:hypothetical protein
MCDVTPDLSAYLTATATGKPKDGRGAVAAEAETAASGQRNRRS